MVELLENKLGLEILTPYGFKSFAGLRVSTSNKTIKIEFDHKTITATKNHRFIDNGVVILANDLKVGDIINNHKVLSVTADCHDTIIYDPVEVADGHLYLSDDIVSHNCDFLGSSATLIRPDAIQKMAVLKPIYDKEGMAVYFPPEKGRLKEGSEWETKPGSYVITVDTAAGVGGDSSSFSVIRVDQLPYVQVARYANNTISPLLYPNIIHKIAMEYNEAWVLIEINKSEQVAYILHNELEYENIIYVRRDSKGQTVSAGFSGQGKTQFGVITDKKTKRLGCSMFKTLVEESKLLIHDPLTISEISTFIEDNKGSYSADDGYHDDTVMTLVLFGWLTGNTYFKELTDIDIRTNIYKLRMDLIEQEILPVGFRVDGNEDHEPNTEGWVDYTPM